jgi:predicted nucleotidyltransferase
MEPFGDIEVMVGRNIDIPRDRIEEFCRRWKIREFSLFGSVLREDFGPQSDVDVLVSFEPDAEWDLFHLVEMRDELIGLFGRDVDLVEKEGLRNPFRRRTILDTREVIYHAA